MTTTASLRRFLWNGSTATGRFTGRRPVHYLSKAFIPSGTVTTKSIDKGGGQGHELLLKAGFIRQSSAGIFNLLPLGVRVVEKIERRIDEVMETLGASKVSLATLASKSLWDKSGRWESSGPELFKLKDRKTADLCLSPTHEEAITKLVASEVNGYRQLPVRVYQIGRKFRDEMRPRGGLLRGKEFIMKDLYTFDDGVDSAHQAYQEVRSAYDGLFEGLGIPFHVAEADSGNIGGELSHEYHLPSPVGEDTLLVCDSCSYVANQELAQANIESVAEGQALVTQRFAHQIYRDSVFFDVDLPAGREANIMQLVRQAQKVDDEVQALVPLSRELSDRPRPGVTIHKLSGPTLMKVNKADPCSKCSEGKLKEVQAIEIGHTFHLGTKYSKALDFKYTSHDNETQWPEMGCHGIGVTRLMAAMAEIKRDAFGLNWPAGLAPYNGVIVIEQGMESVAEQIATCLKSHIDAVDDRAGKSLAYKVRDLQQAGISRILVIGKRFWQNNPQLSKDTTMTDEQLDQIRIELVVNRGDAPRDWKLINLREWKRSTD